MFSLALTLLVLSTTQPAAAKLPASLDLATVRAIPMQHDGRWPPLDTVARDVVESVTGEPFFGGHDPVLLLLAWTFDPETWKDQPLIAIRNAELRGELQLPATQEVFSYAELAGHAPLRRLMEQLLRRPSGQKMNPLESKAADIRSKLLTLQEVFTGRALRPIPDPETIGGAWRPIGGSHVHPPGDSAAITEAWTALRDAFRADNASAFATASGQFATALAALPAAHRPSPQLIATELRYNQLRPFRTAWLAMVAGVALAVVALLLRLKKSPAVVLPRRLVDVAALIGMAAGFAILTYGLWLRWHIAGRIPAANMFESLLFLSWGAGAFGIVSALALRNRFVPLTASVMGAVALILADCLPIDHFVRPIAPVLLDTIWMSIHVPVIMVSYAVLAVAVLIAHGQLLAMAALPGRRALAEAIDGLHYWYALVGSLLLLAGIVTGSMWAASSWGRYWGWDPKEVWSLVAFLGYMAILHVRVDHERVPAWARLVAVGLAVAVFALLLVNLTPLTSVKLLAFAAAAFAVILFVMARGPFATALKSTLAFWLIIMTYVGVNYVLGIGLHSYGFGTGAVVRYLFLVGGIDLALIALCAIVYLARRPSPGPASLPLPAADPAAR